MGTVVGVTASAHQPAATTGGLGPGDRPLGVAPLTEGQVVTTVVGVGLQVAAVHARGQLVGPLRPASIAVATDGRPRLRGTRPAPGWSVHDDVAAVLRLAWSLAPAASGLQGTLRRLVEDDTRRLDVVLDRLLAATVPEPLVAIEPSDVDGAGRSATSRRRRRGRHAARRRWWGRRT